MRLTQKEYKELFQLAKRLEDEAGKIRHMLACREVQDETGKNW